MSSTTRRVIDDPNLLLALIPLNVRARETFSKYNPDRFRRSSYELDSEVDRSKIDYREKTPIKDESSDVSNDDDDEPELLLSLSRPPRNPTSGFVFGSDPDKCDVYLGERRDFISAVAFRIVLTRELQLAMCAESSTNKIVVSYGDGEKQKKRYRYNWVLFPEKSNMTVTLASGLQFQFRFPRHGGLRLKHETMKKDYVQKICGGSVSIDQLYEETYKPSNSLPGTLTYPYKKIYTILDKLGNGTFGSVHEIREASTAQVFAMKMLSGQHKQFRDYRIAHELLEKESDTLAMLTHRRIVKRYDLFAGFGSLCLVMEMLPQGDLHRLLEQTPKNKLSNNDVSEVLCQGLQALDYLHGNRVTHRDLKTANIMVEQRSPVIKIKLVDFGLCSAPLHGEKVKSMMSQRCGTLDYLAPEQWAGTRYNNTVDIWALAVVIMYCMAVSPKEHARENRLYGPRYDKRTWCGYLVLHLDNAFDATTDPVEGHVLYIAGRYMLQEKARDRVGANTLLTMFKIFFYTLEQMEAVADRDLASGPLTPEDPYTRLYWSWLALQHCRWQSLERKKLWEEDEEGNEVQEGNELQETKPAKINQQQSKPIPKPKPEPPPFVDADGQLFSGSVVGTAMVKGSSGQKRDRKLQDPEGVVAGSDSRKKKRR